jgi:hypothetical protein
MRFVWIQWSTPSLSLAADVAGYSRLMGQDEAGTLSRLRTHRRELIDPRIAEHGGRIVKTTGDGLLVEFPSVVEAVACAVAIQRGMGERNAVTHEHQRISDAGVIEPALRAAEILRSSRRPTQDLTAYDLYLPALPEAGPYDKEKIRRALEFLGQAITRDPRYGPALALARTGLPTHLLLSTSTRNLH